VYVLIVSTVSTGRVARYPFATHWEALLFSRRFRPPSRRKRGGGRRGFVTKIVRK
jgi:hypothetical protein